jgi:hypothetical protein
MESLRASLNQPQGKLKAALIPVLALVLATVVWPRGEDGEVYDSAEVSSPASPETGPATRIARTESRRPLPQFDLAATLTYDPFAMPPSLLALTEAPVVPDELAERDASADEASAKTPTADLAALAARQRIQQARQLQVSAIFVDSQGAAALIGSQVVRAGDLLPDGLRVVSIAPEGVKVRLETRQNPPESEL